MLPGVWENVSQMLGPRPPSVTAPSIWYAAVAVPQTKSDGKPSISLLSSRLSTHPFSAGVAQANVLRSPLSRLLPITMPSGIGRPHQMTAGFEHPLTLLEARGFRGGVTLSRYAAS